MGSKDHSADHLLTLQIQFNLEFELRLQQYIEIIRTGDRGRFIDAMAHAKRYLTPYIETQSMEIHRAAGLLAFPRDTKADPYKVFQQEDFSCQQNTG